MSATVQIRQWNGSTGSPAKTQVDGTNTRFHSADIQSSASTSSSILIPESGTNYSFWRSLRMYISAITGGTVDNLRYYTDGSNNYGTGLTCKVATANSYVQSVGTTGETGTQLTTGNHGDLDGAPTDAFGYTSGSPLAVTGSSATTGDFGDFIVEQLEVASTASSGVTAQETKTIKYDDTSS